MSPYNPPTYEGVVCGRIPFKMPVKQAFKRLGEKGSVLKKITENYGFDYVWYNLKTQEVEIWGGYRQVTNALESIYKEFEKFYPVVFDASNQTMKGLYTMRNKMAKDMDITTTSGYAEVNKTNKTIWIWCPDMDFKKYKLAKYMP